MTKLQSLPFAVATIPDSKFAVSQGSLLILGQSDDAAEEVGDLLDALCGMSQLNCPIKDGEIFLGKVDLSEASFEPQRWSGILGVHNADPSFWRIFFQLCYQYHNLVAPIEKIELRGQIELPSIDVPYLQAPQAYPFEFARDITQFDSPLVLRLDGQWSEDSVTSMQKLLEDWASIVYTGGFVPIGQVLEELVFDSFSFNRIGKSRVECVIDGWRSAEAAIDLVCRACVATHYSIQALERVEIE